MADNFGPTPNLNKPNSNPGSPYNNNNNSGNNSAKTLKTIAIILTVALIVCAGVLVYMVMNNNKKIETIGLITAEKQKVTGDLEQLRIEYGDLRTTNDTINKQLDREKQKIDLLLEKIKQTDASNRANLNKIKEYEKEMGSLRSVLRGYVVTIDSLNNLTQQLRAENTQIRQRATESERKLTELSQKTDNLQTIVEKGAIIKARDITVAGINSKNKDVSRARQTEKIRTCLTLTGNVIADKGIRTIFVRVKSPDGSLLTNSSDNLFSLEDNSQLVYSAMREVDYQGDDLEVCIFYTGSDFMAGMYNIEVYMGSSLIGTSQVLLK